MDIFGPFNAEPAERLSRQSPRSYSLPESQSTTVCALGSNPYGVAR
jgi:hypothetical protein